MLVEVYQQRAVNDSVSTHRRTFKAFKDCVPTHRHKSSIKSVPTHKHTFKVNYDSIPTDTQTDRDRQKETQQKLFTIAFPQTDSQKCRKKRSHRQAYIEGC